MVKLLDSGGAGTVCSAGNLIPGLLCEIYKAFRAGDRETALRLVAQTPPFREATKIGTFPAAFKAGCDLLGFPAGPPFAPVSALDDIQRAQLTAALERMNQTA
jgi:4-hydroxy-tetrahydrodipicolinate synthase